MDGYQHQALVGRLLHWLVVSGSNIYDGNFARLLVQLSKQAIEECGIVYIDTCP
jgi:hypothetical protein